jgi:predicted thioesterase
MDNGTGPEPGLTGTAQAEVTEADTASALGSGDVRVLGTPRVVALAEAATIAAVAGHLPPDSTSVGVRVEIEHLAPTPVGGTVRAEATLSTVDGRKLGFEVIVRDEQAIIAIGQIDRSVVHAARFLARVYPA